MEIKPPRIAIDPTGACNYRCQYCWFYRSGLDYPDITPQYLTLAECRAIFRSMNKLGIPLLHISGGGEPLAHPEIKSILREAARNKLSYSLATNGSLIDSEIFSLLTECPNEVLGRKGAVYVAFSIWSSSPEDYAKLHGTDAENLLKVVDWLDKLRNAGIWTILSMTIFPENYDQVYDVIRLASEAGANQVYLRKGFTSLYDDILTQEQLDSVREQVNRAARDFPMVKIGKDERCRGYEFSYGKPTNIRGIDCKYCRHLLTISCDANVYPCCLLRYQDYARIANIRELSLDEIIETLPNFLSTFVCKTHFCTLPEPKEGTFEWPPRIID